jgi:hypothetical protein
LVLFLIINLVGVLRRVRDITFILPGLPPAICLRREKPGAFETRQGIAFINAGKPMSEIMEEPILDEQTHA